MPARAVDIRERLRSKIAIDDSTGCWNWTGSMLPSGYGQVSHNGSPRRAHRVSYEVHRGPIPDSAGYHGTCVLHRCDNRACINPEHLFLGSPADNAADMMSKGRQPRVKCHGAANGQARLTEAEVLAIRDAVGLSQRAIAKKFGVAQGQVSLIRLRKSWKDI